MEQAASLSDLYAPIQDATKPVGQWKRARLVVNGPLIEHWLNGKLVVRCNRNSADFTHRLAASKFAAFPGFGSFTQCRVALQDHGDDVAFRNIRLKQLQPTR